MRDRINGKKWQQAALDYQRALETQRETAEGWRQLYEDARAAWQHEADRADELGRRAVVAVERAERAEAAERSTSDALLEALDQLRSTRAIAVEWERRAVELDWRATR